MKENRTKNVEKSQNILLINAHGNNSSVFIGITH